MISESVATASARATSYVHPDEIPFAVLERPWGTTYMKLLHVDLTADRFTNIIRWPAGLVLPTHRHTGTVSAWTFSGSWHYLEYDWVAGPGSYVFEPVGTIHTLEVVEDTEAMFITQGGFIYYGPDGEMTKYSDAASTLADITAALAGQGLELPPGVVVS
jgi:2,4'-dihydroxyacetophenone dioxygenase